MSISPGERRAQITRDLTFRLNTPERLKRGSTPILLIHYSEEEISINSYCSELFQSLQIMNVPSRLVKLPSENIEVSSSENIHTSYQQIYMWIQEHIEQLPSYRESPCLIHGDGT